MRSRLAGLLVIGALLASACGTQLDEDEVAAHALQQASLGRADDGDVTSGPAPTNEGVSAPSTAPSEAVVAGPATTASLLSLIHI